MALRRQLAVARPDQRKAYAGYALRVGAAALHPEKWRFGAFRKAPVSANFGPVYLLSADRTYFPRIAGRFSLNFGYRARSIVVGRPHAEERQNATLQLAQFGCKGHWSFPSSYQLMALHVFEEFNQSRCGRVVAGTSLGI
jgi:hypothetical protein